MKKTILIALRVFGKNLLMLVILVSVLIPLFWFSESYLGSAWWVLVAYLIFFTVKETLEKLRKESNGHQ